MTRESVVYDAKAIGTEIALAEIAAHEAKLAVRDARLLARDQTRRLGAYVALGRAIARCLLLQMRDEEIKDLIFAARFAAFSKLEASGLPSDDVMSRMRAIEKGISRARVSAEERITGVTKSGRAISVPIVASELDYNSTETEADRQGRANASAKKNGKPELADQFHRLTSMAHDVRASKVDDPSFQLKLRRLLDEIENLSK